MTAFLIASCEGADLVFIWVDGQAETIAHENVQMMCTHEEGQFRQREYGGALLFDKKLFLILSHVSHTCIAVSFLG